MKRIRIKKFLRPISTLIALFIILVSLTLAYFESRRRNEELLRKETEFWSESIDQIFHQISDSVLLVARNVEIGSVSEVQQILKNLALENPALRSAGLSIGEEMVCTSFDIRNPPTKLQDSAFLKDLRPGEFSMVPHIHPSAGASTICVTYRLSHLRTLHALVSPKFLKSPFLFVKKSSNMSMVVAHQTGKIVFSTNDRHTPFKNVPQPGVTYTGDGIIYCQKMTSFDLLVIAYLPKNVVLQSWLENFPVYGLLGIGVGALSILIGWRLNLKVGGLRIELEDAIEEKQIEAFLQPILSLSTGRCVGAEALMRWRHPVRGLVPPVLFIPEAERSGLITAMTFGMLRFIGTHLHPVLSSNPDFQINVNLSTLSLKEPDFLTRCMALLHNHRISLKQLCFEITETASMGEDAKNRLLEFHRMGIRFAVDDFGTGYSNLNYLMQYPFSYLKIDKAFVDGIMPDGKTSGLVDHVIEIGRSCGLELVAEGIEKDFQVEYLRKAGVDYGQGYFLGFPMAIREFLEWLKEEPQINTDGHR